MSVRQSLLAILNQGACYGYQLRTEFDRRAGGSSPINVGQIYNTIDRLERDRLVRKTDHETESQTYYEITDAGRAEVAAWLDSPVVRSTGARDELAMKLAIAATLPGVDIARIIRVQRAATLAILRDIDSGRATASPNSSEELARLLVVDSMAEAAEAELRWLDKVDARVASASAAGIRSVPLNTEVPKRGRPAKASAE